jgi:RNA-binding protein
VADRPAPTKYHWLKLRCVAHPTEDTAKVLAALRFVSGLDEPRLAGALKDAAMESHHGLVQHVYEATLDRSRELRDLLDRVLALPEALQRLQATLEARTDEEGVLYLRLDKQAAFLGELRLTDGEDAIQLRLKLETYPATRAAALAGLDALLRRGRA